MEKTLSKNMNTDFVLGDCLFGLVKLTKRSSTNPSRLK